MSGGGDMRAPSEELEHWIAHSIRESENAARRNKPTMWAYHLAVANGLRAWFESVEPAAAEDGKGQGGFAGAALALIEKADHECPRLPPAEAAHLWALRVYAYRIVRAWGVGAPRASLVWLRERAREAVPPGDARIYPPDRREPCHGDVLAAVADGEES